MRGQQRHRGERQPERQQRHDSGAAYVFVRSGTNWSQQAYLKASNTEAVDHFGYRWRCRATRWWSGRYGEDSNATGVNGNQSDNSATNSGAAYVFVRSGTNWSQQAYLKASNTGADDSLRLSVAVSGDTVVVGAYGEDSNATGVNGNQSDNSATDSGAAYVFVRSGTTWSQQAYLKASNTGAGDTSAIRWRCRATRWWSGRMGGQQRHRGERQPDRQQRPLRRGLCLRAQRARPGPSRPISKPPTPRRRTTSARRWRCRATRWWSGLGEDSNATGVNGNQGDNSAANSGAAYVFSGLRFGPRLALAKDGSGGYYIRFEGHAGLWYRLLRAPNVTGPSSPSQRKRPRRPVLVEFHDPTPPPASAFYRVAQP